MAKFAKGDLDAIADAVAIETGDADLARRIVGRLTAEIRGAPRRTGRRSRAVLDPFEVYSKDGETGLRDALLKLDLEQLKDLVAQYGMDPNRLAMKWKTSTRLVDHIAIFVASRSKKGGAFRDP